jgi:hypothetical protein
MTNEVLNFLQQAKKKIGLPPRVLEVGSLNINGSARQIFQDSTTDYTGIDQVEGPDVDLVINVRNWYPGDLYDLVICVEALEHDPYFWQSVEKMKELLKSGGWLIITTPGIALQKHEYPGDYYRFFGSTYQEVFFKDMDNIYIEEFFFSDNSFKDLKPNWIFGYAQKR